MIRFDVNGSVAKSKRVYSRTIATKPSNSNRYGDKSAEAEEDESTEGEEGGLLVVEPDFAVGNTKFCNNRFYHNNSNSVTQRDIQQCPIPHMSSAAKYKEMDTPPEVLSEDSFDGYDDVVKVDFSDQPTFDKYLNEDCELIMDEQEAMIILVEPITPKVSNQNPVPNLVLDNVCLDQELGSIDFIGGDQFLNRSNYTRYDDLVFKNLNGVDYKLSAIEDATLVNYNCIDGLAIKGLCYHDSIWEIFMEREAIQLSLILAKMKFQQFCRSGVVASTDKYDDLFTLAM